MQDLGYVSLEYTMGSPVPCNNTLYKFGKHNPRSTRVLGRLIILARKTTSKMTMNCQRRNRAALRPLIPPLLAHLLLPVVLSLILIVTGLRQRNLEALNPLARVMLTTPMLVYTMLLATSLLPSLAALC